MGKFNLTVRSGKIVSFDAVSGMGEVKIDNQRFQFACTCFRSQRPLRLPRLGEPVEVVLTPSRTLVSVRATA
jgi:hypothetical protein